MKPSLMIITATLISLLAGCYDYGGPYSMRIDSEFTDFEVKIITECMKEWYDATGRSEDARIYYNPSYHIGHEFSREDLENPPTIPIFHKVHVSEQFYQEMADKFNTSGQAQPNKFVWIVDGYYTDNEGSVIEKQLRSIVLHELGHFFWLEHWAMGDSLLNGDACLDDFTILSFCDKYDCGADTHSTCPWEPEK